MRRIRQGVATEAYWASTVREPPHARTKCAPLGYPLTADTVSIARHEGHNSAGADAAAHECNHIYETRHLVRGLTG
jgi:hypothetical protein